METLQLSDTFLYFVVAKSQDEKKKRKTRAFLSKMQHPPTHKVTAGMSLNYLMEDC